VDPHKALEMLLDAAQAAYFAGALAMMTEAGRRVSTLAFVESEPEASLVDVLVGVTAMLEAKNAQPRVPLREAVDRLAQTTEPRWLTWAGVAAALIGDQAGDDAFRRRAEVIGRRSMAVGNLAIVLARTAWAELMNYGRVVSASSHAEEGLRLAVESGLTNAACFHRSLLSWVAAVRGEERTCVALADLVSDTATKRGLAVDYTTANWAVGLLHLGLGQWHAAAARLDGLWQAPPGTSHPYLAMRTLPDLVEAAVRAGHLDLAESAAARFAEYASATGPDSVAALTARCRAVLTNAPDAREELLSEALILHDRAPRPFDRARTLLLLGEHLRRERRRQEARMPLRTALDTFEQLGASPWSERARRELRATGQTVRRRDAASTTELTVQERQVARIVATGATNKEAAALLFLSPRTVEYHLRSLFSKLGISSRTELARLRLEETSSERPG
jgi:DNA-binding CsgD family transcriptional regulator